MTPPTISILLPVRDAAGVVRALAEDDATRHLAVDAISWQDEESRFYGCMGSRSFCGDFPAAVEAGLRDKDRIALTDALEQAGPELIIVNNR